MRIFIAAIWLLTAPLAATAAESILTARAADYQSTSRFGRYEIRAELSGTVDLMVQGTTVVAEVYTGSTLEGSAATYTQPLPRTMFRSFRALSIGAAKVRVLEEPSRTNGYTAKIRVESKQRKLANVRLLWETDARFDGIRLPVTPTEPDNALEGRMVLVGRFANTVELRIRGNEVLADGPFVLQRLTFTQPLPKQKLSKFSKSGKARIAEPPDQHNNFTANIRVEKAKPEGEDRRIELIWRR